ncbi:hypothetical protein FANTH_3963 [Fusarium anthophilum]|uniref:Uncharacterized protein n=1 Tax=Fusarium anthophilum TaxID=48485 RepID=A0A8H5E8D5_9HYPO|nr:hypothetical protein FANTH_3963 [Fusarium anthophilum]
MSYNNNDEQARRAQAARNAQWASNRSQPQNLAPYQTGGYVNLNEPTIHTTGTVPMNLLNTPSSHSVIPDVPHNPAPLPLTYQSPIRQQESLRTVLGNTTYNQGGSSRGPPDVGYGAQSRSYYGQAPQNPGLGPSGSSQRPPDVGYGAQPHNYYGKAPPNPRPGPSGSQAAQMYPLDSMSNPIVYRGPAANRDEELEMQRQMREEKKANRICSQGLCCNPTDPGKATCEYHLEVDRRRRGTARDKKRAEGKCYEKGCSEPAVDRDGKCRKHIDAMAAYYQARK